MPTAAPPVSDPLDDLAIPIPCTVPWDSMKGDDRRRYCGKCRLHVHDLSAMTRPEALDFLAKFSGGRICARFARRPDGRVMTRDCRDAVRALRRRALLATAALVGAIGLGGAALALARQAEAEGGWASAALWQRQPFATIASYLPASWFPQPQVAVAGRIAMTPSRTPPTPPENCGPGSDEDEAAGTESASSDR